MRTEYQDRDVFVAPIPTLFYGDTLVPKEFGVATHLTPDLNPTSSKGYWPLDSTKNIIGGDEAYISTGRRVARTILVNTPGTNHAKQHRRQKKLEKELKEFREPRLKPVILRGGEKRDEKLKVVQFPKDVDVKVEDHGISPSASITPTMPSAIRSSGNSSISSPCPRQNSYMTTPWWMKCSPTTNHRLDNPSKIRKPSGPSRYSTRASQQNGKKSAPEGTLERKQSQHQNHLPRNIPTFDTPSSQLRHSTMPSSGLNPWRSKDRTPSYMKLQPSRQKVTKSTPSNPISPETPISDPPLMEKRKYSITGKSRAGTQSNLMPLNTPNSTPAPREKRSFSITANSRFTPSISREKANPPQEKRQLKETPQPKLLVFGSKGHCTDLPTPPPSGSSQKALQRKKPREISPRIAGDRVYYRPIQAWVESYEILESLAQSQPNSDSNSKVAAPRRSNELSDADEIPASPLHSNSNLNSNSNSSGNIRPQRRSNKSSTDYSAWTSISTVSSTSPTESLLVSPLALPVHKPPTPIWNALIALPKRNPWSHTESSTVARRSMRRKIMAAGRSGPSHIPKPKTKTVENKAGFMRPPRRYRPIGGGGRGVGLGLELGQGLEVGSSTPELKLKTSMPEVDVEVTREIAKLEREVDACARDWLNGVGTPVSWV